MSYFNELILDTTNNYGIVTETLFNYVPKSENVFVNTSFIDNEHLKWILTNAPYQERAFQETFPEKTTKGAPEKRSVPKTKKRREKKIKKIYKIKGKVKKCLLKLLKKKGKKGKTFGLHSKYMLPLILGLVVAKSLLVPIVLKALTLISAKALMLGFISMALGSVLSLKGMFGYQGYQHRIDDAKRQLEIIRLPPRKDEHSHYNELYSR